MNEQEFMEHMKRAKSKVKDGFLLPSLTCFPKTESMQALNYQTRNYEVRDKTIHHAERPRRDVRIQRREHDNA